MKTTRVVAAIAVGLFIAPPTAALAHPNGPNSGHLKPWTVNLCMAAKVPTKVRERQTMILVRRISGLSKAHFSHYRIGRCDFVVFKQPVSNFSRLVEMSHQGSLVEATPVPAVKDTQPEPFAVGDHVRFPGDRVTQANKHLRVVKIIVASNEIETGSAAVGVGPGGSGPVVNYALGQKGGAAWCSWTSSHVNYYAPVVLDRVVVISPTIQSAICGGQTQVTGLSKAEANALVADINFGSLPVPWASVESRPA